MTSAVSTPLWRSRAIAASSVSVAAGVAERPTLALGSPTRAPRASITTSPVAESILLECLAGVDAHRSACRLVVVPLDGSQGWSEIETFTSKLPRTLARAEPERYVATASKARRKGRIYIDWLRNKRSATAIVPYSLRARPTASIAMPMTWKALGGLHTAAQFTAAHVAVSSIDPWRGFFALRQRVSPDVLSVLQQFG